MLLWIVGGAALFLYAVCKGRKKMFWPIPPFLLLVGVASLVWAPIPWIGGTIASYVGTLLGLVLSWIPGLATGVAAAIAILVLGIAAVLDLTDKKPEGWVKTFIVTAPFLAVIGSGPIPNTVQDFTRTVSGEATSVVTNIASG